MNIYQICSDSYDDCIFNKTCDVQVVQRCTFAETVYDERAEVVCAVLVLSSVS